MLEPLTCAKAPCKSCPYRCDVPSGIWHEREYNKLPAYDGDVPAQVQAGAFGIFLCHQQDGCLCAGWLGCHGASNLLALRLSSRKISSAVWEYKSPVSLFKSGAAACAHGKRKIIHPDAEARRAIARLEKKRLKREEQKS